MTAGRIVIAAVVGLGLTVGIGLGQSLAEPYPTRPIRIIVPTPAGGPVDVIARLVGNYLTQTIGQPVVVDNRPGAGNTLGSKEAAQAQPGTPEDLAAFVAKEIPKWQAMARLAGIGAE